MTNLKYSLKQFILRIVYLLFIVLIMQVFVFGVIRSSDNSMAQAVKFKDLAFTYRLDKEYYANDLTVYEYEGQNQIRRVVARSGDTVDINEDGLIINDQLQSEPSIYEETMAYEEGIVFPVTLEKDEVFLLADARENASDSRYYGPVKASETKGTIIAILRHSGL